MIAMSTCMLNDLTESLKALVRLQVSTELLQRAFQRRIYIDNRQSLPLRKSARPPGNSGLGTSKALQGRWVKRPIARSPWRGQRTARDIPSLPHGAKRLKIRFRAVAKRQRGGINKFVNQPAAVSMNRLAATPVTSALPTCQNKPNRDRIMRRDPVMQHVIPKSPQTFSPLRPRRRMNRQESGAQTRAQRRARTWPGRVAGISGLVASARLAESTILPRAPMQTSVLGRHPNLG